MEYGIAGAGNFLISEPGIHFPERLTYKRWLSLKGRSFRNAQGELIILDTGKLNPGGPDFVQAVLFFNGDLLRGSVEIHRTSSDWYAHAHHLNPEYDEVILQIVFADDSPAPVISFSGKKIPSFFLDLSSFTPFAHLCLMSGKNPEENFIKERLRELGGRRVEKHITRFLKQLQNADFEEAFYSGMCDALGYGANRQFFNQIPRIVTLRQLNSLISDHNREIHAVYTDFLKIIQAYSLRDTPVFNESAGTSVSWKRGGFRPANHPFRRLATLLKSMDALLFGELPQNLLRFLMLEPSPSQYIAWLKRNFRTEVFIPGTSFLEVIPGSPRLIEASVNVILPLLIADSRLKNSPDEERISSLLNRLPAGERITKYSSRLKEISPSLRLSTALEWQGLIHLSKAFCASRHCQICPLVLY